MHDPSQPNRQGNDRGPQYRSAIFYHSVAQRTSAERVIERVNGSGIYKGRVVTQLAPAGEWSRAEKEHQDYLQRNPGKDHLLNSPKRIIFHG